MTSPSKPLVSEEALQGLLRHYVALHPSASSDELLAVVKLEVRYQTECALYRGVADGTLRVSLDPQGELYFRQAHETPAIPE